MGLADQIENYRIHFGAEMPAEKAHEVIEKWRAAAQSRAGAETVELAAPFQRHYTKLGTGLPPNFCLALTREDALAFKLDPRNPAHPLDVAARQIKKQVARWPRAALRITAGEPGKLSFDVTIEVAGPSGSKTIPCRTPRLSVNPAAAVMITELGGVLPNP